MSSLIKTDDGSQTIYSEQFNEHYHSTFGALSESVHVFIEAGLKHCKLNEISIFEVGFGTGLNAILTYIESIKQNLKIKYTTIELFPVDINLIENINYNQFLTASQYHIFNKMHSAEWNTEVQLDNHFAFTKIKADLTSYIPTEKYDVIYFDAFAPDTQTEMWTFDIFERLFKATNPQGFLTTYSSKGIVKKNMRNAGFKITRLQGPKGKHHILRAEKV